MPREYDQSVIALRGVRNKEGQAARLELTYGIAELPIWDDSKGSSISLNVAKCRISPPIFWQVAPKEL